MNSIDFSQRWVIKSCRHNNRINNVLSASLLIKHFLQGSMIMKLLTDDDDNNKTMQGRGRFCLTLTVRSKKPYRARMQMLLVQRSWNEPFPFVHVKSHLPRRCPSQPPRHVILFTTLDMSESPPRHVTSPPRHVKSPPRHVLKRHHLDMSSHHLDMSSHHLDMSSQLGLTCTFRASCYSTRLSRAHTRVINWAVYLGRKVSS